MQLVCNVLDRCRYDFLVDAALQMWLLEINCSPTFEHSTPITAQLVADVSTDVVKVTVDVPALRGGSFARGRAPVAVAPSAAAEPRDLADLQDHELLFGRSGANATEAYRQSVREVDTGGFVCILRDAPISAVGLGPFVAPESFAIIGMPLKTPAPPRAPRPRAPAALQLSRSRSPVRTRLRVSACQLKSMDLDGAPFVASVDKDVTPDGAVGQATCADQALDVQPAGIEHGVANGINTVDALGISGDAMTPPRSATRSRFHSGVGSTRTEMVPIAVQPVLSDWEAGSNEVDKTALDSCVDALATDSGAAAVLASESYAAGSASAPELRKSERRRAQRFMCTRTHGDRTSRCQKAEGSAQSALTEAASAEDAVVPGTEQRPPQPDAWQVDAIRAQIEDLSTIAAPQPPERIQPPERESPNDARYPERLPGSRSTGEPVSSDAQRKTTGAALKGAKLAGQLSNVSAMRPDVTTRKQENQTSREWACMKASVLNVGDQHFPPHWPVQACDAAQPLAAAPAVAAAAAARGQAIRTAIPAAGALQLHALLTSVAEKRPGWQQAARRALQVSRLTRLSTSERHQEAALVVGQGARRRVSSMALPAAQPAGGLDQRSRGAFGSLLAGVPVPLDAQQGGASPWTRTVERLRVQDLAVGGPRGSKGRMGLPHESAQVGRECVAVASEWALAAATHGSRKMAPVLHMAQ